MTTSNSIITEEMAVIEESTIEYTYTVQTDLSNYKGNVYLFLNDTQVGVFNDEGTLLTFDDFAYSFYGNIDYNSLLLTIDLENILVSEKHKDKTLKILIGYQTLNLIDVSRSDRINDTFKVFETLLNNKKNDSIKTFRNFFNTDYSNSEELNNMIFDLFGYKFPDLSYFDEETKNEIIENQLRNIIASYQFKSRQDIYERILKYYDLDANIYNLNTLDWTGYFRSSNDFFSSFKQTDLISIVDNEEFATIGSPINYVKILENKPIKKYNTEFGYGVVITYYALVGGITEERTAHDDGAGNFVSSYPELNTTNSSINYDTGLMNLVWNSLPKIGTKVYVAYQYSNLTTDIGLTTDKTYRTPFIEIEANLTTDYLIESTEEIDTNISDVSYTGNLETGLIDYNTTMEIKYLFNGTEYTINNKKVLVENLSSTGGVLASGNIAFSSVVLNFTVSGTEYSETETGVGYFTNDNGFLDTSEINYIDGIIDLTFNSSVSNVYVSYTSGEFESNENLSFAKIDFLTGEYELVFYSPLELDSKIVINYSYNELWNEDIDISVKYQMDAIRHCLSKLFYSLNTTIYAVGGKGEVYFVNDNSIISKTTNDWITNNYLYFGTPNDYSMDLVGYDNTLGFQFVTSPTGVTFTTDNREYYKDERYLLAFMSKINKYKVYFDDGTTEIDFLASKSYDEINYEESLYLSDGQTASFTGEKVSNAPVNPSSVTITFYIGGAEFTETDDGFGNFSNTNGFLDSATIDYETGKIDLTFFVSNVPDIGEYIYVSYEKETRLFYFDVSINWTEDKTVTRLDIISTNEANTLIECYLPKTYVTSDEDFNATVIVENDYDEDY